MIRNRFRWALAGVLALTAGSVQAQTVYDWSSSIPSGGGSITGAGTITVSNTLSTGYDSQYTGYLVSAITGVYDGVTITGLLGVNAAGNNDNLVNTSSGVLDEDGIAFNVAQPLAGYNGNSVNIFYYGGTNVSDNGPTGYGSFTLTAVPEPASMALLATGIVGLIGAARRRQG